MVIASNGMANLPPSGLYNPRTNGRYYMRQYRDRIKYFKDKKQDRDVNKQINELKKENDALRREQENILRLINILIRDRKKDRSELRNVSIKKILGDDVER